MGELLGRVFRAALISSVGAALAFAAVAPVLAQEEGKDADAKDSKPPAANGAAAGAAGGKAEGATGVAVPPADFWALDFTFQKVAAIQPTDGVRRGETYWYLIYRIENKTGQDRDAFISITARSNRDKTYSSVFLPDIETLVERKIGKPLWGKVDEVQILRERASNNEIKADKGMFNYFTFKAGESRECVAVFNKLDPGATQVTITVEGLSNDVHLIQGEDGSRQIQSRIYVLELERPGDEYAMNLDRFLLKRTGWLKKLTKLGASKEG